MKKLLTGASSLAVATCCVVPAFAQDAGAQAGAQQQGGIPTIVVTATKRSEDAQDIPVAVQAIGTEELENLGIDEFTDYLVQLPNVTAGGGGPGQSTIYIRGVASTTPNLTTAGVAGLAPNVALYLDEQPLSQPGRNLDVYAIDLERIEVLPGPQGTLFGASSQAGTIRLITNKPRLGETSGFVNASLSTTKGGEESYKLEGGINLPLGDIAALRVVGYYDDRGGYIDNVAGTQTLRDSARFRPGTAVRENGTVVGPNRAGFQSDATNLGGIDSANTTFIAADNSALVEDDFNDTSYKGFRASLRAELTPDWTVTLGYAKQWVDSEGVFFEDPDLGEYNVQRYERDEIDDDFDNINWTVEGRIGALEVLYTGAYTKRDTAQRIDYTDYLFIGQYLPYYLCDSTVSYPVYNASYGGVAGVPFGTCQAPNLYVASVTDTKVLTQELRFNTPADKRIRLTAGGFYSDLQLDERNDFNYPNNVNANVFGSGGGFSPNFPFMTGYTSDDGPFAAETIFRNDVRRTDKQWGLFGELSFDIVPDVLTAKFGARYYDVEVDLEGSANSSFCNSFQPDANAFGTDISDQYNADGQFTFRGTCNTARHITYTEGQSIADIQAIDPALSLSQATAIFNALAAPDKASTSGYIFKGSLSYTPTEDLLFYLTYSEGFRPGLLNRPGGRVNAAGTFTVPFEVETDEVTNYEFGWKTNLAGNQLQFNGNAFYVDIKRLQTTIFDPTITNLFFSANAADARVYGIEGDLVWAPYSVPGLTVTSAFSILDTKITNVLIPTGDVTEGSDLAFAPSFQGNIRARYEWDLSDTLEAHIMPQVTHSAGSRSDILDNSAIDIDSWTMVSLTAGVSTGTWKAELFADNLFDTHAILSANGVFDVARQTPARPRTIGIRLGYDF
ncbi:TonB-dependent receptor [Altererythrobacter arenosus]|uniref:TonB-dependent receptor n=1 Tax=Altererythrobacter arenosus TaxID=3032592 RepID=A0ABY8FZA4_9SPHN|nr:TonB-dependent receptor [Altererythrobacter sp. CAU 1644]WFL77329.1 TonB-dependent receptor [Altererythrobacter sp. CAU 1644]